MSLFKKKKNNPKISIDGIEYEFNIDNEWWDFSYSGVSFNYGTAVCSALSRQELDKVLDAVTRLAPEMKTRLFKRFENTDLSKEKFEFIVYLDDFYSVGSIEVSWYSESVNSIEVDFTIKNGEIIDESWGD